MRHGQSDTEQSTEVRELPINGKRAQREDFVLEKSIFSNIFEKDIRRIYIYKKAERLAKAIHLVTPAFIGSAPLKDRIDAIAIGLIDAAIQPPRVARAALSRELLALSSLLSIARTGSILSSMNAELISREAHILLNEVAAYEEPRALFDETPTLSSIAKDTLSQEKTRSPGNLKEQRSVQSRRSIHKGHVKDIESVSDSSVKDRRGAILSIIRARERASIKDISTLVRGVSEKTIQRELSALIDSGAVKRQGERRWSIYSLA